MRQEGGLAPFLSQREPKEACALGLALAGRDPGFFWEPSNILPSRISGFGGSAPTVKAKPGSLAICSVLRATQGQWEILDSLLGHYKRQWSCQG